MTATCLSFCRMALAFRRMFFASRVPVAVSYTHLPAGANGDRGISVTLSYNQDGGHKEIMESIIGDLAKVGVTAVSDTPEWSALLEPVSYTHLCAIWAI